MFPGPQQVVAHRPQRVAFAAAVATDFLLASGSHVGERRVGETHDVEVVGDAGRSGRRVAHGGLVADVGVDHHRLDAVHTLAERFEAVDQHFLGAALDEVPQPGAVEVHEAGHETPVATERGLVDAQVSRRSRRVAGELVPRRRGDGPPRRGPTHPERPRHRRRRAVHSSEGDRRAQPGRHTAPRRHLAGRLGPNTARRLATKPPLRPHQHRRAVIAQPVAHPAGPILLDPRAERPTAHTRRIRARHTHRHLQHTGAFDRAGHLELLQPAQRTRNITHLGASLSRQMSLPDSRGPDPRTRTLRSEHVPHQTRRAGLPA